MPRKCKDKTCPDIYDRMDQQFPNVETLTKKLATFLTANGYKVISTSPPDYDQDGEIELENNIAVQVCLDGTFMAVGEKDGGFTFKPTIRNFADLLGQIKELRT